MDSRADSVSEEPVRALFESYPRLRAALPFIALGTFPTPVERLHGLEQMLGSRVSALCMKRDDLSGRLYGGNKVRKLEFILARAMQRGCSEVLTFGGAGSNHALATALYARELGLRGVSMLIPQPNSRCVRQNLLRGLGAGAEFHQSPGMLTTAFATLAQLARHRLRTGRFPYLIAPGGSSPVGMIGFVNAAFELKQQIDAGLLSEPDCIYAASGSMGTVIGLLLGLKAAGLRAKIVAVRVTPAQFSSVRKARRLFAATNAILCGADPSFPNVQFPAADFLFCHDFYGREYGRYTPEAMEAVELFGQTTGVRLEGTYTGKTLAALLADVRAGRLEGKKALFWNTYNSSGLNDESGDIDYHSLPKSFHRYFEEEVQPLDK